MKTMTVQMAAKACGGSLLNCADGNIPLGRAMIDSRAVQPGDLFVAYKGENTDGHKYINKAFENGAVCALAEYMPENISGPVILCESVQTALEKIATAYRNSLDIPIVGITGSVGKTTAKEMVSAVLSQRFSLLKTDGNLNNQIGVPMTVSRIEREHEAAVVEMGISGFGEVRDASSKTYALMLKSRILGENPCNVDKIFRKIKQFGGPSRQGGGVSGIEIALWDLAGKAYGVPVYQLLGGKFRDEIRVYCDTDVDVKHTGHDMGLALKKRMDMGFTFLKMPKCPLCYWKWDLLAMPMMRLCSQNSQNCLRREYTKAS